MSVELSVLSIASRLILVENAHQLGPCWWQISSISSHNIVDIHLYWTWFTQTTVMGVKPGSEYFCLRVMCNQKSICILQCKNRKILSCDVQCNVLQHASDSFYMHFQSQRNASKNTVDHALLYRPNLTDWTDADTVKVIMNHGEKLYIILHVNTCNYYTYIQWNLANLDLHAKSRHLHTIMVACSCMLINPWNQDASIKWTPEMVPRVSG